MTLVLGWLDNEGKQPPRAVVADHEAASGMSRVGERLEIPYVHHIECVRPRKAVRLELVFRSFGQAQLLDVGQTWCSLLRGPADCNTFGACNTHDGNFRYRC